MDARQEELYEAAKVEVEKARDTAGKMTKSDLYKMLCESGAAAPRNIGCRYCRAMCLYGIAYHIKLGHEIILHRTFPYVTAEID